MQERYALKKKQFSFFFALCIQMFVIELRRITWVNANYDKSTTISTKHAKLFCKPDKAKYAFFTKKRKNLYEWVRFHRFNDDACIYP